MFKKKKKKHSLGVLWAVAAISSITSCFCVNNQHVCSGESTFLAKLTDICRGIALLIISVVCFGLTCPSYEHTLFS